MPTGYFKPLLELDCPFAASHYLPEFSFRLGTLRLNFFIFAFITVNGAHAQKLRERERKRQREREERERKLNKATLVKVVKGPISYIFPTFYFVFSEMHV